MPVFTPRPNFIGSEAGKADFSVLAQTFLLWSFGFTTFWVEISDPQYSRL